MTVPVAVSVFTYGLVFGVLAHQAGLSVLEVFLMSSLVFAGAAQFSAIALWPPASAAAVIVFTTLVVNLRHLLMGAALRPWLSRLRRRDVYPSLFLMNDETWALTLRELSSGYRDAAFLAGSGVTIFVAWVGSTVLGRWTGTVVVEPEELGLDFVFAAVFLTLLVGLWKGKGDLVPWLVAGAVAVLASETLGENWYVVLGAVAGTAVGSFRRAES